MARERILITVKTYPTLSRKYGETVCTAGVREDGSWIRLYPVPFRRLDEQEQYRKFDWLECDVVPARNDPRPETRHPSDFKQLIPVGSRHKVSEMRKSTQQGELFADDAWRATFKVIPKLPYSFSYRFEDDAGKKSELQVLDWEVGALYWNCLRDSGNDEAA